MTKLNNNNRKLKARGNISPITDHCYRKEEIKDTDPLNPVFCVKPGN